ncbi:putative monooxygenase [Annulohypoxylon bovei var. microspora]|nr:putative monooxygenase [Annulohypoxylon bovei var. microspora]
MADNSVKPRVLIVGAGIGGLVLAQCLRKESIPFEVFERDAGPTTRSGWAIGIHSLLDELASSIPQDMPPIKEAVNHLSPLNLEVQMGLYAKDGRRVVQSTPESPIIRANRLRLRKWLVSHIPVQWGKILVKVEKVDNEVRVHFEDGTEATGGILVGADGVNSVVREHILQRSNKELLKIVPATVVIGETTMSGECFERQLSLGHSCFVKSGQDSGYFLFVGLAQANQDGSSGQYYWFTIEKDEDAGREDHRLRSGSQAEKLEHALKLTSALEPKFTEVVRATPASGIWNHSLIFRDIEIEDLPAGRITLLGDAAHSMTPFRGEGGVHAIRDALNLGKALAQLKSNESGEIEAVLGSYQKEMLERGVAAVRKSRHAQTVNSAGGGETFAWGRFAVEAPEENVSLKDCLS